MGKRIKFTSTQQDVLAHMFEVTYRQLEKDRELYPDPENHQASLWMEGEVEKLQKILLGESGKLESV